MKGKTINSVYIFFNGYVRIIMWVLIYPLIVFIKMLASTYLEYTKNRYSMLAIIVENT